MTKIIRITINLQGTPEQLADIKALLERNEAFIQVHRHKKRKAASSEVILHIIEQAHGLWVNQSVITRKTQEVSVAERNKTLTALGEQGIIEHRILQKGRGRATHQYRMRHEIGNVKSHND